MINESWFESFGHELEAAGVLVEDRAAVLVETEGFVSESDVLAFEHFGPPAIYANVVAGALGRSGRRSSHRMPGEVVVSVDKVGKSYRKQVVLKSISLRVCAGEVVVVTGPNGAGKSTLLRLIAGIERSDSGSVSVSGRVGYVPQTGGLDPYLRPSEHFVVFGAPYGLGRQASVREGARLAHELGWDALDAPVAGELSGGTRQKLSVILALLGSPRLLLLDEPYQGMDAESSRRFWDLLWAWQDEGGAALVSSHSPDALSKASAVIELEGIPVQ